MLHSCLYVCRVSLQYEYQIAIFYADRSEDAVEQFVQGKLLVKLENKWNYKTFVPQRDDFGGSCKIVVIYIASS